MIYFTGYNWCSLKKLYHHCDLVIIHTDRFIFIVPFLYTSKQVCAILLKSAIGSLIR